MLVLPEAGLAIVQPKPTSTGFTPFEFQSDMVRETYRHIHDGQRRILLIAGTGAGKTAIATIIMQDATQKARSPRRCVFLVRLTCLLDQSARTFRKFGIKTSIYQANRPVDWGADVIVASLQTIQARMKKQPLPEIFEGCSLFICDEAHEGSFDRAYIALEETFLRQGAIFLGLTASPWRTSPKQGLCERYDVTVIAPQPPELVKLGRIVPARIFHPGDVFDPDSLDVASTGDYVQSQVEEQALKQASLDSVVKHWIESAQGRTTVAFCPGVKTAEALCQAFVDQGVAAEWQSGSTPLGKNGQLEHQQGIVTRAAQDYRLSNGITKILCNVMTLTAGWDVPEIELVIFYMETLSRCKWVQATGRGARTCDRIGKRDFWIYDYGCNASKRFGSPTGYQDYSIQPRGKGNPPRKNQDKTCPNCGALNSNSVRVCTNCGYEFVKDLEPEPQMEIDFEVKLTEFLDETGRKQIRFLRSMRFHYYQNGLSPDEAEKSFKWVYGFTPPDDWFRGATFGTVTTRNFEKYEEYLCKFSDDDQWIDRHIRLEFGSAGSDLLGQLINSEAKWWEILGVQPTAPHSKVEAAYRELALQYHPDVCDAATAEENMKLINRAFDEYKAQTQTQTSIDQSA